jgi:multisubunit Na+/H+ antiporter MnhE subunit
MGRARYWVAWWAAFFALWLLLVTISWQEVTAGAVAAAIAATGAEAVRANDRLRFRPEPRWLGQALRLPPQILQDTWVLIRVLARKVASGQDPDSAFRAVPFRAGGRDARSSARRALVKVGLSAAPNTVVIGIDGDQDLIVIHYLLPHAISRRQVSCSQSGESRWLACPRLGRTWARC